MLRDSQSQKEQEGVLGDEDEDEDTDPTSCPECGDPRSFCSHPKCIKLECEACGEGNFQRCMEESCDDDLAFCDEHTEAFTACEICSEWVCEDCCEFCEGCDMHFCGSCKTDRCACDGADDDHLYENDDYDDHLYEDDYEGLYSHL